MGNDLGKNKQPWWLLWNGERGGPKWDLLQCEFQLLRQKQLPLTARAFLQSSIDAPILDGDWQSSALIINGGFLLQIYRLCKPSSASVTWGLQRHAHDEWLSSALQQAASERWELAGISGHEKTEVQVPRTAACRCAWWRWSTGLEQPSCWWIVDSPSQQDRIHLCWDKRCDPMDDDKNSQRWYYCLASVSSRGKRMGCYYVPKLVIYVWG